MVSEALYRMDGFCPSCVSMEVLYTMDGVFNTRANASSQGRALALAGV